MFDLGEEYEFEIIKDDDGDGSLTLSIRKIQVRNAFRVRVRDKRRRNCPRPSNASLFVCVRSRKSFKKTLV